MRAFLSGTNWLLIISLIFGSAALAVLGDSVGSKYGKKRISLFGMRPKHTSRLITALTGALIAVGILGVMSIFSQDVRTALFGMKLLRQQMYSLQFQLTQSEENTTQMRIELAETAASLDLTGFELDSLRNDKLILEQEKNELEASLRIMREESEQLKREMKSLKNESIALNANVLLGHTAFEAGSSHEEIIEGLEDLKQAVKLNVLERISNQSFTRLRDVSVEFDESEEAKLIDSIASADMRQYVRALSGANYTLGEKMDVMIKLQSGTSIIIYPDNSTVYKKFFEIENTNKTSEEILHVFLRELRNKAINDGVLPEPATNNIGTMDGESFFSAVEELGTIKGGVIISAVASGDIYTEGPVTINIFFEE
ncbi:MAG: DUF3084 domain-containing protein [Synergistaceae bacterium]|nr:DUF3084 domain-containing protein [Synergistaceae bacterium]